MTVQEPLTEQLNALVTLAGQYLGCDGSGVTVRGPEGSALTLAASDPVASAADQLQTLHADGPAVSPVWPTAQVAVDVVDAVGATPWPTWTRALAEAGIRAVLATQVVTTPGPTGSLTLYYHRPASFSAEHLTLARLLAQQAAAQIDHAQEVAGLRTAIEGRTVIGQAQGLLMERYGLTAERAFAVLVRQSQNGNAKLLRVAEELVRTRHIRDGGDRG